MKTFKLICSKVILRSGLKKKYIPAGEYLNLSLERERFKYCRDIFFLKQSLLSSVKERMAIQEIENDAYDLVNQKPVAAAVAVGNRLLVHKIGIMVSIS